MPIDFSNNVPFKLTPQDVGGFDLMAALTAGQQFGQSQRMFPEKLQEAQLLNALKQVQAKYAEPMAQQNLLKAQQYNEMYKPDIQSQIGLRGAQAGKLGKETEWYDREAAAKIAEQQALAGMHGADAQKTALIVNELKKRLGQQGQDIGGQAAQGQAAQGQAQAQSQVPSSSTAQQTSSMYGIDTPALTNDDIINKMVFGTDTYQPKIENAKKQQEDQYNTFNKKLLTSVKGANAANNLDQAISVFNNAMDRSTYKGSRLGNVPSSGWLTPPFSNMSPEQEADRASAQMLPDAIATLKASMGAAQFSNLDMMQAGKMKFDRTMDDDARQLQTKWVNAVNSRSKEEAKFYQVLSDPHMGVTAQQADMLWRSYQDNMPLIGKDSKGNDTVNFDNLGNWPLYTTPKAINSIKSNGVYTPSPSEKNTYMMKYPDGKILPVKKGQLEIAFQKGARPL
jgi:hypothetical protein